MSCAMKLVHSFTMKNSCVLPVPESSQHKNIMLQVVSVFFLFLLPDEQGTLVAIEEGGHHPHFAGLVGLSSHHDMARRGQVGNGKVEYTQ